MLLVIQPVIFLQDKTIVWLNHSFMTMAAAQMFKIDPIIFSSSSLVNPICSANYVVND